MSRSHSFLQQGVPYGNTGIISASELPRLQPSMYPSDIPNLAGNPFSLSEENMWAPDPTTLPTINPSCIATSGAHNMQSYLASQQFGNMNHKQIPSNRRRSSAEAEVDQGTYQVRHGQVTPPDNSPATAYSVPSHNSKSAYPPSSIEGSSEASSKRRRSGSSALGGSRASTRASTSVEPDDKQEKTRARNRLAASKCRQKKKEQNHMLETRYEQEKMKNEELTRTVNSLRDAIVVAKDQLLAHSECGHESIKAYIQNMAKNITTQNITTQHEQLDSAAALAQYHGCHLEHNPSGYGFDAHPPTA
ncbi:hypothetical protein BDW75DRAFT_215432 [Aspergillus navahoensis]